MENYQDFYSTQAVYGYNPNANQGFYGSNPTANQVNFGSNPNVNQANFGSNAEQTQTKSASDTIKGFMDYLQSGKFKEDVNINAQRYNVSPKRLADTFLEKVLVTIGDVLGIAVNTVGNIAHTIVNILSSVLNSGITLIENVGNSIANMVSLNKYCAPNA